MFALTAGVVPHDELLKGCIVRNEVRNHDMGGLGRCDVLEQRFEQNLIERLPGQHHFLLLLNVKVGPHIIIPDLRCHAVVVNWVRNL